MDELQFRVMASSASISIVGGHTELLDQAVARLEQLEQLWSRFLPESDISKLNFRTGTAVPVHHDTIALIHVMQKAYDMTLGRCDATVLPYVINAGYIRSHQDPSRVAPPHEAVRSADISKIVVDGETSSVELPIGCALDPGGIGKGFAADLVVTELLAAGAEGAMVSVGGDLVVGGDAPTAEGWTLAVADPFCPDRDIASFHLREGSVCTSSTRSRRWKHQGSDVHHLIDPVTGVPSCSTLASVTAIAAHGWMAEAHAKAALLEGEDDALSWLSVHGLSGVIVREDGTVSSTDDLSECLVDGTHR